ncbi:hypothetical protein [Acuticoccus mangrovi]|uniref:Uncharacterized protein n=1 Tax=Acuticoccus mangrovi TaxID=2796142 RepID=A0A934ILN2_9HYPH|nr:hypothetical protein [Acuticoccus mangrovi]MBJ3774608.1 hypothetical protein [Acuticoccus mangrovi]
MPSAASCRSQRGRADERGPPLALVGPAAAGDALGQTDEGSVAMSWLAGVRRAKVYAAFNYLADKNIVVIDYWDLDDGASDLSMHPMSVVREGSHFFNLAFETLKTEGRGSLEIDVGTMTATIEDWGPGDE